MYGKGWKPWKRGYPLRIQLVKYVVWLWLAICEHKGKAACKCVTKEFADTQISNKDDGGNLQDMSQECNKRMQQAFSKQEANELLCIQPGES